MCDICFNGGITEHPEFELAEHLLRYAIIGQRKRNKVAEHITNMNPVHHGLQLII